MQCEDISSDSVSRNDIEVEVITGDSLAILLKIQIKNYTSGIFQTKKKRFFKHKN